MANWVKKTVQYILFLGIGVALLYLTFKNVNPIDLWNNLKEVPVSGLLLVVAIGFIAIIFRGLRWVQMLQSLGYEVKGTRAIAAVAFSYLVNLVTPRVGEVARCTALHKTDHVWMLNISFFDLRFHPLVFLTLTFNLCQQIHSMIEMLLWPSPNPAILPP